MALLFLSHAGIDSDAARALKQRILASPAARAAGLQVWLDKDNLDAGRMWQGQLDEAIARSTAFAVLVGSRGVVNWVEAEVQLALGRAMVEPQYRFIPVLAADAPDAGSLPGFARLFQGVRDVDGRVDQFERLMAAVLGGGGAGAGHAELEAEPFFGLRAIDESRSHLFFGRARETDELLRRVYEQPLVLVSGDSGSGKSSLVRAGLVPRFRGGALAVLDGERPQDAIWNVVVTRPRSRPWTELGNAIEQTAETLGLSLADRGALADWASSRDPEKIRRALRCGLPADHTHTLLVVDQFEELITLTPEPDRTDFIAALLTLADPGDDRFRVVLAMRHDYVNLCNSFDGLRDRLDANGRRARFLLGRMTDEGLRHIVTEPLRLAGISLSERETLADDLLKDVGQRPGDLALVQMALTETWRARAANEGHLARAYVAVGRVEGALAGAAEQVRTRELTKPEHAGLGALLDSVLVRVVRLGDTGGATRRVASRQEFDDERWRLVQLLASEEGKRLVILGGSDAEPTAEIAHEALVTAWPHYQTLLQSVADDKRIFDALIPKARDWQGAAAADKDGRLATGAELEQFTQLLGRRRDWLSDAERNFVTASADAVARRKRRDVFLQRAIAGAAVLLLVALAAAGWFAWGLRGALDRVNGALAASIWNRLDSRQADDKLAALWEVRQAPLELRRAFLSELTQNPVRAGHLGRNADSITRAFALRWTPADATAAVGPVLRGLDPKGDYFEQVELAEALRALAPHLPPEPARLVSAAALRSMTASLNSHHLLILASALARLRVPLSDQDRKAAIDSIVRAREAATAYGLTSDEAETLRSAMRTVARTFTADEANAVLTPVLAEVVALRDPERRDVDRLDGRLLAAQELGARLTPEQARVALPSLVNAFATITNSYNFDTLAAAAVALPTPFTDEQAGAALAPLLDAMRRWKSGKYPDDQLRFMAMAVEKLAGRLPAERAKAARDRLVETIRAGGSDASASHALARALVALPLELEDGHVNSLLVPAIKQIAATGKERPDRVALAMAPRLTPRQSPVVQAVLLEEIHRAVDGRADSDTFDMLAAVLNAMPVPLTPAKSTSLAERLVDAIATTKVGNVQMDLVKGLGALPVALTAAQSKIVFDAAIKPRGHAATEDNRQDLADAIEALSGKLSAADAQAAFATFVEFGAHGRSTTNDEDAKTLRATAKALTADQMTIAFRMARFRLGWSAGSGDDATSAEVLVRLVRQLPADKRVSEIVELLKYPTAGGPATDVLLDALHEAAPEAPGKDAGFYANLDWLARRHPALDLDAPPACPQPLQGVAACPASVR